MLVFFEAGHRVRDWRVDEPAGISRIRGGKLGRANQWPPTTLW